MKLQAGIQEALVALLCYDEVAGAEVAGIVEPKDFDPVYRQIAEAAIEFRERHRVPPGEHTVDLFDAAAEADEKLAAAYERMLASIEVTVSDLNPAYVVARAREFVRYQRVKGGIERALRQLAKDTAEGLEAAEAEIVRSLKDAAPSFHGGLDLLGQPDEAVRFLTNPTTALPTGIPEFDRLGLGPKEGELHLLMADSNKGKSWWLVHLAAEAWKVGANVLYVSMEMSEESVASRFAQRFLSVSKRQIEDGVEWEEFLDTREREDAGSRRRTRTMGRRPAFTDRDAEATIRKGLRRLSGQGRIQIRAFPQGTLTPNQLDSFLTVLEERERFIPNLLLVDYPEIMKLPVGFDSRWEAIIEAYQQLRAIAQTRRLAVATVSQIKASGQKAKRVDVEHADGSKGKIATADTVFTYSQSEEEQRHGLARIWNAKARNEETRFGVVVSQAYAVGQFVMDSARLGANYDVEGGEE